MELSRYLVTLARDGAAFAELVTGRLDQPVPSCPGWTLADLTRHVGEVHHFWRNIVEHRHAEPHHVVAPVPPDGDQLVEWYRRELAHLERVLATADPTRRALDLVDRAEHRVRHPAHGPGDGRPRLGRPAMPWVSGSPSRPTSPSDGIDEFLTHFASDRLRRRPGRRRTRRVRLDRRRPFVAHRRHRRRRRGGHRVGQRHLARPLASDADRRSGGRRRHGRGRSTRRRHRAATEQDAAHPSALGRTVRLSLRARHPRPLRRDRRDGHRAPRLVPPYFEEARVAWLRARHHPYDQLRAEGFDIAVLEAAARYLRPLRFDEVVSVHLAVVDTTRTTFQVGYLADGRRRGPGHGRDRPRLCRRRRSSGPPSRPGSASSPKPAENQPWGWSGRQLPWPSAPGSPASLATWPSG